MFSTVIIYILSILFGFGLLVFFHEFGHFIVAKIFKIKVEKFSIGMGPAIFGFKKGETYFQIGAVPFGGFCKFKGDETLEDVPVKFTLNIFKDIINKPIKLEYKQLIENNYIETIPDEIKPDKFEKLLKNIQNEKDNELVKSVYRYDAIDDIYELRIDEENDEEIIEASLLKIIKNTDPNLIYFKLKNNITKKEKNNVIKAISKAVNLYKLREPGSFYGSPPYKRILVALFGPMMNYIIAVIFFSLLIMTPHEEIKLPNKIILSDDIRQTDEISPSKRDGLKSKDIIIKIDDVKIDKFSDISKYLLDSTFNDFFNAIIKDKRSTLRLTILRDNKIIYKNVKPEWDPEGLRYLMGISYFLNPIIDKDTEVTKELGFKIGDEIIGIDEDKSNICTSKVYSFFYDNFGLDKKSTIYIKRNNKEIQIPVDFVTLSKISGKEKIYEDINFKYDIMKVKGKNPFTAFKEGFIQSNEIIKYTFYGLAVMIFKPKKNVQKQIGGPIKIGKIIGDTTVAGFKSSPYEGFRNFFSLAAMLSLVLAFFNLLPIPALDGGHIVMYTYEMISRRNIKMKLLYLVNMIFFMILIGLALVVAVLDITQIIQGIAK